MTGQVESSTGYYDPDACDLREFLALIDQTTRPEDVPQAAAIEKNIPLYDLEALRPALKPARPAG